MEKFGKVEEVLSDLFGLKVSFQLADKLKRAGIFNVKDIEKLTDDEFINKVGLSEDLLNELRDCLCQYKGSIKDKNECNKIHASKNSKEVESKHIINPLKRMIDYRKFYMYDFDCEKIEFVAKPGVNAAKEQYRLAKREVLKDRTMTVWHFDVALNLLRNLSEEDLNYMREHPRAVEYHHGYGTYIRNKYVYSSNIRSDFADDESAKIIHILLTMVHPQYDFRNKALRKYYNSFDYPECKELYYEQYKECFDEVEKELSTAKCVENIEDPIDLLKNKILSRIGRRGFMRSLDYTLKDVSDMEEYHKIHSKGKTRIEVFIYRLSFYIPLYNLEYKQLKALEHIGAFVCLNTTEDVPEVALTRFIDNNLNLKDEDRDFMIECIIKIFGMFKVFERY